MKKLFLLITTIAIVVTLSACNKSLCDGEHCVYVTVYPMQYLVEEIGGNNIQVVRVPGSQVHSESIDWSAKEIIDMKNADILFYINGGVDTYIPENANTTFEDSNVLLIDMSEGITYNEVCFSHEHDHSEHEEEEAHTEECDENSLSEDPHFWLDPVRMLTAATIVRNELILEFPQFTNQIEENYDALVLKLTDLDTAFQAMADAATKPVITTVMLFSYWHVRYDIEILSITTSAHSSESSASDIIYFSDEAEIHDIHYILFEKNTNSPAGDGVLEELLKNDPTAQGAYLHGLGNLTNDEIDDGLDYMTIMYENLSVLIEATK